MNLSIYGLFYYISHKIELFFYSVRIIGVEYGCSILVWKINPMYVSPMFAILMTNELYFDSFCFYFQYIHIVRKFWINYITSCQGPWRYWSKSDFLITTSWWGTFLRRILFWGTFFWAVVGSEGSNFDSFSIPEWIIKIGWGYCIYIDFVVCLFHNLTGKVPHYFWNEDIKLR